jgi:hypothetical protein
MRASILLATALALGAGLVAAPARGDDAPISDAARAHFKAGVNLLQDPDGERVEDAYREFKAAYAISASSKILGNIGYCAMRLERDGEAIEAYTTYLREVKDIDAEERAQITRDLSTMQVGLVKLEIRVNEIDARVSDVRIPVKGGPITNAYGPVRGRLEVGVRPGHHIVTVRVAGFEDAVWELEAQAGSKESRAFEMKKKEVPPPLTAPPSTTGRPPPIGPWITIGLGGALLAAGTITGILALGKTSDIASACPNDACPAGYDLDGNRSSARGLVRATDFLLLGGGLVAAGGLTWLLLSGGSSKTAAAAADGFRVRF